MSADTSASRRDPSVAPSSDPTTPRKLVPGFISSYLAAAFSLHDAEEDWLYANSLSEDDPSRAADVAALATECSLLADLVEKRSKRALKAVHSAIARTVRPARTVAEASLLAHSHATWLTEWLKSLPDTLAKRNNRWSLLIYDGAHRPVVLAFSIHHLAPGKATATNSEDIIREVFVRLNGDRGQRYTERILGVHNQLQGSNPRCFRYHSEIYPRLGDRPVSKSDASHANLYTEGSLPSSSVLELDCLASDVRSERMVEPQHLVKPTSTEPFHLPHSFGNGVVSLNADERKLLGLASREECSTKNAARIAQGSHQLLADLQSAQAAYDRCPMYQKALQMFNFDFEQQRQALRHAIISGKPVAPYKTLDEQRGELQLSDAEFLLAPWLCVEASPFYKQLEYLLYKGQPELGFTPVRDNHLVQRLQRAARACGISLNEWVGPKPSETVQGHHACRPAAELGTLT